jgi:dihydrofolate reductase
MPSIRGNSSSFLRFSGFASRFLISISFSMSRLPSKFSAPALFGASSSRQTVAKEGEPMRKLIVVEHISIDGVIQGPGGVDEDPTVDFQLGGWTSAFSDEAGGKAVVELHEEPFELLLGRRTYDIWSGYWPHAPASNPFAERFNATIKHVATHRPDTLGWKNSRALEGDPAEAVRALLMQDGPRLLSWGSGHLNGQLLAAGLVDELQLFIYPVVLGPGKRLFTDSSQASAFTLHRSLATSTGTVIVRYVRSGAVVTGSLKD